MKKLTATFIPFAFLAIVFADVLQNPNFELPPSRMSPNSSVPSVPLNENNTIPGWTSEGTVQYIIAGPNAPLPRNEHAVLLAEDGKINQTFIANGDIKQYLLTFTLALGGPNCSANVSLVVSAPDSASAFLVKQNYSKEPWEVYGHLLGSFGNDEAIDLVLQSQNTDTDTNSTCWPVVDTLILKALSPSNRGNDNLLPNGGFESGPAFLDGFTGGVLLDSEPSIVESALREWSVLGTVRYIDSKHYFVPEGNAAIEIITGESPTGIQAAKALTDGSSYNLEFVLGDANDSCKGNFIVGVQAGSSAQNFTVQSAGTGSANKYSMTFKAESSPAPISFQSYTIMQNDDGVLCGPVIDGVILRSSSSHKSNPKNNLALALLVLLILRQMLEILP